MIQLSEDRLNSLNKETLIILVSSLQEQLRIMNQRHFGCESESSLSDMNEQLTLFDFFNKVEFLKKDDVSEPEIAEVIISSYHRKMAKGKRDTYPEVLPSHVIEYKLSDERLIQKFPEGYKELPHEIYNRLHIIPETFIVDEHHVHIYASNPPIIMMELS